MSIWDVGLAAGQERTRAVLERRFRQAPPRTHKGTLLATCPNCQYPEREQDPGRCGRRLCQPHAAASSVRARLLADDFVVPALPLRAPTQTQAHALSHATLTYPCVHARSRWRAHRAKVYGRQPADCSSDASRAALARFPVRLRALFHHSLSLSLFLSVCLSLVFASFL
jgi:hypothetical protein